MSARHTPGPWMFGTEPQPNGCPIVGARGLMVAMLAHSINYDDQRETALANARLIAAAPDLLKTMTAIHDALAILGECDNLRRLASDAIAKATGGQS